MWLRRLGFAIVLLVAAVMALRGVDRALEGSFRAAGPTSGARRIQVAPGTTVRGVLAQLGSSGALAHPLLTQLYLRVHGRRFRIKAGEYEIPAHASAADIITMLAEGRVVLEQLTIIEGSTFDEFRRQLEADAAVRSTFRGESDAAVMAGLGYPGEEPEGRFFPDTYRFAAGTTDLEILHLAYSRMQQVLESAWSQRAGDLPFASPYAALILASIVEKETGLAAERPLIAGVFVARLKKGMRLQSDPTVIYGLGAGYDGQIHTSDLTTDTPYNTYTRAGLPPTPIALPGREAIFAAVRPQLTGALYFVATGDGDGAHHFSATLEEQDAAIQHYLARLRARSTSAAPGAAAPRAKGGAP